MSQQQQPSPNTRNGVSSSDHYSNLASKFKYNTVVNDAPKAVPSSTLASATERVSTSLFKRHLGVTVAALSAVGIFGLYMTFVMSEKLQDHVVKRKLSVIPGFDRFYEDAKARFKNGEGIANPEELEYNDDIKEIQKHIKNMEERVFTIKEQAARDKL